MDLNYTECYNFTINYILGGFKVDIKLNFVEKGSGDVLVLLHGNGEDTSYFVHQIEYFSRFYRVIAIDTRGHGLSPRGTAPFTIAQFAEDLYNFFVQHSIEKANILGFSDGGNIALTFALKYPQMVQKLILNGANLNPQGVKRVYQKPIEEAYKRYVNNAEGNERYKKKAELYGLMVNEPDFAPEDISALYIPTLVIAGKKDMIKTTHTKLIAKSLPCAQLSIIDGDHFIANGNSDEFNRVVHQFLK